MPAKPTIDRVIDNVNLYPGELEPGDVTNDASPTFEGTADPGNTVELRENIGGTVIGTAVADANGNWTFEPQSDLRDFPHFVIATATDGAGNASEPSDPFLIIVDTTPPRPATINDTDGTSLSGTAVGAMTVLLDLDNDGFTDATATVDPDNWTWTYTPATPLADGTVVSVESADRAGNLGAAATVEVDAAPVPAPSIEVLAADTGVAGDWITEDNTPTFLGTLSGPLSTGQTVAVSMDGGNTWSNATVDGNQWQWAAPGSLAAGNYEVWARVAGPGESFSETDKQSFTIAAHVNVAPEVTVRDAEGLLGIADANLLGLINIGQQQFFAATDDDNNIQQVRISFGGVLNLLALQQLNANAALAAELGLQFSVVNNPGLLGIGASSVLTVSALDGGAIDNLNLNEFLGSVTLTNGLLGVNVGLLNSLTITATDTEGASTTSTASQLASLGVLTNLLGGTQSSAIIEGTANDDTLNGTSGDNRIYGYDGQDVLNGQGGNDLLRGGAGDDILDGGTGNDILIGGAGYDSMTGGTGTDVFLWELLDNTDSVGGNSFDDITGFHLAAGPNEAGADRLDISALLIGYVADADGAAHYVNGVPTIDAGDNILDYINVVHFGSDTVIQIDRDGTGSDFGFSALVQLNSVTASTETLLANQQLMV